MTDDRGKGGEDGCLPQSYYSQGAKPSDVDQCIEKVIRAPELAGAPLVDEIVEAGIHRMSAEQDLRLKFCRKPNMGPTAIFSLLLAGVCLCMASSGC